jgi:hypothetical protein
MNVQTKFFACTGSFVHRFEALECTGALQGKKNLSGHKIHRLKKEESASTLIMYKLHSVVEGTDEFKEIKSDLEKLGEELKREHTASDWKTLGDSLGNCILSFAAFDQIKNQLAQQQQQVIEISKSI